MGTRMAQIAHYVIFSRNHQELGKTKLAKILWSADLMMYRLHGKTVTGSTHAIKLQFGPVPKDFFEAIKQLKRDGKIVERETPTLAGQRIEYIWISEPDLTGLTAEDVATVDRVAEWICKNHTAASISEATHDALWEEVRIGGDISIKAAAAFPGEITPSIMEWAEA